MDDGKKSHEEDEDEDDDEEVDGNSIVRFDDSGDRNPEDDQSKNLGRRCNFYTFKKMCLKF